MNFISKYFGLSFHNKFFRSKLRKTLSIFGILLTLGLGGTLGFFVNSNSKENATLNPQNKTKVIKTNSDSSSNGIELRRNPISNFDSISVESKGISPGSKLMLSTKSTDKLKEYGVSLVDNHYNIITSWFISSVSNVDVSLNYTTYIIHGNSPDTFFVLAGISNLAQALNLAYDSYDSNATIFDSVVHCDLQKAPTIKIFKIHVENNQISSDKTHPFYDFKYPTFKDNNQPEAKNFGTIGLKFFTNTGLFNSYTSTQQIDYAGDITTYGGGGYYQYLFYGQLFQYNYNTSVDNDEFALISTYVSSDREIGNLYAYYDEISKSVTSALHNRFFYENILKKVIDFRASRNKNEPYKLNDQYSLDQKIPYKIQKPDGSIETAPESDQLTVKTAIAIAFMMDYKLDKVISSSQLPYETKNPFNSTFTCVKFEGSNTYVLPGWFIFKPSISPDWVAYGYFARNSTYTSGNSIWYSIVSLNYDFNNFTKKYDAIFVGPEWITNKILLCFHYQVDLFNLNNTDYEEYSAFCITLDSIQRDAVVYQFPTSNAVVGYPFVGKTFVNDNFFVLTSGLNNNNLVIGFPEQRNVIVVKLPNITNKINDMQFISFGNLNYDPNSHVLTYINNLGIFSIPINKDKTQIKSIEPSEVKTSTFSKSIKTLEFVYNEPILDKSLIYSFDDQNYINGTVYYIKDASDKNSNYIYSVQSLINKTNGNVKVLELLNPTSFGHSIFKKDDEFSIAETNHSISDLLNNYSMSDLRKTFIKNERTDYTIQSITCVGAIITHADSNNVALNEVVEYNGHRMFGFAKKDGSNVDYWNYASVNYTNVFQQLIDSTVWYVDPKDIPLNSKLKNVTVHDLFNEYQKNFNQFQKDYFDSFVVKIDNKTSNLNYQLHVIYCDENNNEIQFSTVAVTKLGEVTLKIGNPSYHDQLKFTYKNVFKKYQAPNNAITWIIVGSAIAVISIVILGLSIGIPLNKRHKAMIKRMNMADKKVATLITALGKVFKTLNDGINSINRQNARLLEARSPNSSPIRPAIKKPVVNKPFKPLENKPYKKVTEPTNKINLPKDFTSPKKPC